jgi:ribosomal protein L29
MKQPEDMSLSELRAELRELGVTERLSALILREMGAADRRVQETIARGQAGKTKLDPLRAQLFVLKAHQPQGQALHQPHDIGRNAADRQVGLTEVGLTEVGLTEVGLTNVGLTRAMVCR